MKKTPTYLKVGFAIHKLAYEVEDWWSYILDDRVCVGKLVIPLWQTMKKLLTLKFVQDDHKKILY